jgi:NitT/TauT family transport system substrate-binding protein
MSDQRERWSRRECVRALTIGGTMALIQGVARTAAVEPPPETTRIRLEGAGGTCQAPKYVADELLRAEGFTDLQYLNGEAPNLSSRRLKALSRRTSECSGRRCAPPLIRRVRRQPSISQSG